TEAVRHVARRCLAYHNHASIDCLQIEYLAQAESLGLEQWHQYWHDQHEGLKEGVRVDHPPVPLQVGDGHCCDVFSGHRSPSAAAELLQHFFPQKKKASGSAEPRGLLIFSYY